MVTKWIGLYGNKPNYTNKSTNHLFVEISPSQVVYLVKNTVNAQMEAIEIFHFNMNHGDWSDIFFEIKEQSALIGLSFSNTSIYFNINEALLLPLNNLSASSADDFLSLVYGPEENTTTKHDKIEYSLPFVTIYRIKNSLIEILNRNFILFNIQHTYSPILRDVFERDNLAPIFLKLVVYYQHIIVVYIKDNQLQLTQTYSFKNSDDPAEISFNLEDPTKWEPFLNEEQMRTFFSKGKGLESIQRDLIYDKVDDDRAVEVQKRLETYLEKAYLL